MSQLFEFDLQPIVLQGTNGPTDADSEQTPQPYYSHQSFSDSFIYLFGVGGGAEGEGENPEQTPH